MNPLLPEPVNNLGRTVSFTAKSGSKTDSQDTTRFSETLKENTPQKRKTSEAGAASRAQEKNAARPPESRTHGKNDNKTPEKPSDTAKAPAQEKEKLSSGKQSEEQADIVPDVGPMPVQETVQSKGEGDLQLKPVPASASPGTDEKVDKPVESTADAAPSLLQTGQGSETVDPLATQPVTGQPVSIHPEITQPEAQAVTEEGNAVSAVATAPALVTPPAESLTQTAQPASPETDALPARPAKPAGIGINVQVVSGDETAAQKPMVAQTPLDADAQETFAAFETEMGQTAKAADKNTAPEKPALPLNMANASPALQPGYVKSNLDWRFGTRTLATDAEAGRDGGGLSAVAGASSSTGAAHAAISVTPMQFHDLAADQRVQMPVNIKFGQPEWAGMVAERTAMMSSQKISVAELQLDPPELGPLHVKVTVHHDQASVNFVSASPAVRDSLEQTAVRLRELLDQQGLDLVDVNVSDQSDRQQYSGEQGDNRRGGTTAGEEEPTAPGTVNHVAVVSSGIDHYA